MPRYKRLSEILSPEYVKLAIFKLAIQLNVHNFDKNMLQKVFYISGFTSCFLENVSKIDIASSICSREDVLNIEKHISRKIEKHKLYKLLDAKVWFISWTQITNYKKIKSRDT